MVIWGFRSVAIILGLLGLVFVLFPGASKTCARACLKTMRLRFIGLLLMVIGAWLFAMGHNVDRTAIIKVIGAVSFIIGGIMLLLPMVAVVLMEMWVDRNSLWRRALGLLLIALAYPFATAELVITETPEAAQETAQKATSAAPAPTGQPSDTTPLPFEIPAPPTQPPARPQP